MILSGVVLGSCLIWVYWPGLSRLTQTWSEDPRYSYGYLVPVFALYLVWTRRGQASDLVLQPSWWGLFLLAAGLLVQMAGSYLDFPWLSAVALLPLVTGLAVLLGGRPALQVCWPAILFLGFMIPLPQPFDTALAWLFQPIAAQACAYTLQTLGWPAWSEDTAVVLQQERIDAAVCSNGLGCLMMYFAVATAVVLLLRRRREDRIGILVSAIPLAFIGIVVRLTATALLYATMGHTWGDLIPSSSRLGMENVDLQGCIGYLMIPLTLLLICLEIKMLGWVLVEPQPHWRPGGRLELDIGLLQRGP
jgi:exosortase